MNTARAVAALWAVALILALGAPALAQDTLPGGGRPTESPSLHLLPLVTLITPPLIGHTTLFGGSNIFECTVVNVSTRSLLVTVAVLDHDGNEVTGIDCVSSVVAPGATCRRFVDAHIQTAYCKI